MARLLLIAFVLAAATLPLLTTELAFDAYGWLTWGRELIGLDLATGAGPSWKPLTSLLAAPLTLLGDDAAKLGWLLIARTGSIAMILLAARLAVRLLPADAGRRLATIAVVVAGVCATLIADSFTPLARQFAIGLAEPLAAALVLAAADRALDRCYPSAAALLALAGLIRPEALVLLAVLVAWLWRRHLPREATIGAAALAAALVLWLVPDLIGTGDVLAGAGQARQAGDEGAGEGLESIWRGLTMPLLAAWVLAIYAVADARRHGDRRLDALAVAVAIVFAVVAAMAVAGYPGLPRFMLPAAALVAVAAGVGAARLDASAQAAGAPRAAAVAAAVLLLAVAGQAAFRIAEAPAHADSVRAYEDRLRGLSKLLGAFDAGPAEACERIKVTWFLAETKAAWELGLPIGSVTTMTATAVADGLPALVLVDPVAEGPVVAAVRSRGAALAEAGDWAAYGINCATPETKGNMSSTAGDLPTPLSLPTADSAPSNGSVGTGPGALR